MQETWVPRTRIQRKIAKLAMFMLKSVGVTVLLVEDAWRDPLEDFREIPTVKEYLDARVVGRENT